MSIQRMVEHVGMQRKHREAIKRLLKARLESLRITEDFSNLPPRIDTSILRVAEEDPAKWN